MPQFEDDLPIPEDQHGGMALESSREHFCAFHAQATRSFSIAERVA